MIDDQAAGAAGKPDWVFINRVCLPSDAVLAQSYAYTTNVAAAA